MSQSADHTCHGGNGGGRAARCGSYAGCGFSDPHPVIGFSSQGRMGGRCGNPNGRYNRSRCCSFRDVERGCGNAFGRAVASSLTLLLSFERNTNGSISGEQISLFKRRFGQVSGEWFFLARSQFTALLTAGFWTKQPPPNRRPSMGRQSWPQNKSS